MTAGLLFSRWSFSAGCGHRDCFYSQSVVTWEDPVKAVAHQMGRLLKLFPDEVANEWGGTAYETIPSADKGEVVQQIVHGFSAAQVDEHRWWMKRKVTWQPYGPDNVSWTAGVEDPFMAGLLSSLAVGHATDAEIAEALQVDVETVRRYLALGLSDDELVDALLEQPQ